MEAMFLKLLNMSITASWLVLAVLLLRLLLRQAPKAIRGILWALVGIRLVCPFSVESMLSLIPSAETVPKEILYTNTPIIHSGVTALNQAVNPIISESLASDMGASANPMQVIASVAAVAWIIGMLAILIYTLVNYLVLHRKVREAILLRKNIWLCDRIPTPFILGVFRPRIFLPSSMQECDIDYVIAHEKAHLKRRDHWWKPLGFALCAVYWFNPILWIAYIFFCRDIELACDEKVIADLGGESKKPYADALIHCSMPRRMLAVYPVAFGEVGVKARIKTVLHYKKPALWLILVAAVACVAVAVCFLTNPKTESRIDASSSPESREGWTSRFSDSGDTFVRGQHDAYDSISYDIDGDDKKETCALGYGLTSGVFTFELSIWEDGKREYSNIFTPESYHALFFEEDESSKLRVCGKELDGAEHWFDIRIENGYVYLSENGKDLKQWL